MRVVSKKTSTKQTFSQFNTHNPFFTIFSDSYIGNLKGLLYIAITSNHAYIRQTSYNNAATEEECVWLAHVLMCPEISTAGNREPSEWERARWERKREGGCAISVWQPLRSTAAASRVIYKEVNICWTCCPSNGNRLYRCNSNLYIPEIWS